MPTLLLLNGPPAVGKSTLAHRWVEDRPLTLALDIDALRSMFGRTTDRDVKVAARHLAIELARVHLASGHDVVVPQLAGDLGFIERLDGVASDTGAAFHEVVLVDDVDAIEARFLARRTELAVSGRSHPELEIPPYRVRSTIAETLEYLAALVEHRPRTITVAVVPGDVDATCIAIAAALSRVR